MNKNLLNTGVQEYIINFSSSDILAVSFQKPLFEGVSNKELVQQLESRQKCKQKLPLWYNSPEIYYPKKEAIEQSSSQATALYKSSLVSGKTILDLTGGMGVDSYYFSKSFSELTYCERQEDLADISSHNFKVLGAENILVRKEDGLDFLKNSDQNFDAIYLDPARRTRTGRRIFLLSDAEPPLPESLDLLWPHTRTIVIKTSPLLDLASGIRDLGPVREVHVVSLNNEAKELLWILEKGFCEEPLIVCLNIRSKGNQKFTFRPGEEKKACSSYANPSAYVYEPNASVMKAGPFGLLGQRMGLTKLHPNSHLYTDDSLKSFPGRVYEVIQYVDYKPRLIKGLRLNTAHVISRNFPESVETLRKKFGLRDGGDKTLIFTRGVEGELICILCERVKDVP